MNETRKRNPAWTRDELILALDFYVKYSQKSLKKLRAKLLNLAIF